MLNLHSPGEEKNYISFVCGTLHRAWLLLATLIFPPLFDYSLLVYRVWRTRAPFVFWSLRGSATSFVSFDSPACSRSSASSVCITAWLTAILCWRRLSLAPWCFFWWYFSWWSPSHQLCSRSSSRFDTGLLIYLFFGPLLYFISLSVAKSERGKTG